MFKTQLEKNSKLQTYLRPFTWVVGGDSWLSFTKLQSPVFYWLPAALHSGLHGTLTLNLQALAAGFII